MIHQRKLLWIICVTSCLIAGFPRPSNAQVAEGWPIQEDCVSEAVEAPDNWTFPGLILLSGNYGIHAVSDEFRTTFVVAFIDRRVPGAAGLSPDGQWYATGIGDLVAGERSEPDRWLIEEIRVHAMQVKREFLRIPIRASFENPGQLRWWDNNRLIYQDGEGQFQIFNAATEQISPWQSWIDPLMDAGIFYPAPTWMYAVYDSDASPIQADWGIYEPISGDEIGSIELAEETRVVWKPDSSGFVAEIPGGMGDDNPIYQLALFDPQGQLITVMMTLPEGERVLGTFDGDARNLVWSADGRWLALISTNLSTSPISNKLYILDLAREQITDPCISSENGLAWSPDGTQLAFMGEIEEIVGDEERRPIMVLDVDAKALVRVAQHAGSIIGWRG